jgi:hypothetical protein
MNKPSFNTPGNKNPSTEIVEKALMYARGMFRDPDFREFMPERIEQIGCQPNTLFQADKDISRVRMLVSYQSEIGDWGLNRAGLDYLLTAQQEGKITVGVVVLTADFTSVTKAGWIVPVFDAFRAAPLRRGRRYGPYYWSDADLRPAPPRGSSGRYISDPDADVPF